VGEHSSRCYATHAMTLGLATGDQHWLYLAIESAGIPMPSLPGYPRPLGSKLIEIQADPVIAVLVSGGLWNWREVAESYASQPPQHQPLRETADAIDTRLKQCPKPDICDRPPSFGLVCGFEEETAICYRVSSLDCESPSRLELRRGTVVPIGITDGGVAEDAAEEARRAIVDSGVSPPEAIEAAIRNRLHLPTLKDPVEPRAYAIKRRDAARSKSG